MQFCPSNTAEEMLYKIIKLLPGKQLQTSEINWITIFGG